MKLLPTTRVLVAAAMTLILTLASAAPSTAQKGHAWHPTWNLATFMEDNCNPNMTIGPPLPLKEGGCHDWPAKQRWHSIGPIWAMRRYKNLADDPYKGKWKHNEPDPDLREYFVPGSCRVTTYAEPKCHGPFIQAFDGDILEPMEAWCLTADVTMRSLRVDCKRKDRGKWE